MSIYRMREDMCHANKWYVGDIRGVDNWQFLGGVVDTSKSYTVDLVKNGVPLDFSMSVLYGIPVISSVLVDTFSRLSKSVDLVALEINSNFSLEKKYYAVVVKSFLDAVDEKKSKFNIYSKDDLVAPEKIGMYKCFDKLVFNKSFVGDEKIFRLSKYKTALFVDGSLKEEIERLSVSGVRFSEKYDVF